MRAFVWTLVVLLVAAAGARPAASQEDVLERIEVSVTAVSGGSVFLDKGQSAGLRPGDTVRLTPFGQPQIVARIRSVSSNSSRIDLTGDATGVAIGISGEVLIPSGRLAGGDVPGEGEPDPAAETDPATAGQDPAVPPREIPEHPPWEAPPEEWNLDTPLLAPIAAREPEDRDPLFVGRLWTFFDYTVASDPTDQRYTTSRTGADIAMENPFGNAGAIYFEGEFDYRLVEADESEDETDSFFVPKRLFYRMGGFDERPRWQFGRFLQYEFPEFGILDGVELDHALNENHMLGGSLGFMPERNDELSFQDDLQTSFFYRYDSGTSEQLTSRIGYQKTWFEGSPDRDLVVANIGYFPDVETSMQATAWVDYYTSDDDLKSGGFELTQLHLNGNHRWGSSGGVGISGSYFRWPQLLRDDFVNLAPEQVTDDYVSRIGLNGWKEASEDVRLNGSINYWMDEDDNGGSANVTVSLDEVLYDGGFVNFSLYGTEAEFTSGLGFRTSALYRVDPGLLNFTWDITNYEQQDFGAGEADLLQNLVRLSYDTPLGSGWDLSFWVEDQFGSDLQAFSVGFFLQKRL